jgi:hypothetical protein
VHRWNHRCSCCCGGRGRRLRSGRITAGVDILECDDGGRGQWCPVLTSSMPGCTARVHPSDVGGSRHARSRGGVQDDAAHGQGTRRRGRRGGSSSSSSSGGVGGRGGEGHEASSPGCGSRGGYTWAVQAQHALPRWLRHRGSCDSRRQQLPSTGTRTGCHGSRGRGSRVGWLSAAIAAPLQRGRICSPCSPSSRSECDEQAHDYRRGHAVAARVHGAAAASAPQRRGCKPPAPVVVVD